MQAIEVSLNFSKFYIKLRASELFRKKNYQKNMAKFFINFRTVNEFTAASIHVKLNDTSNKEAHETPNWNNYRGKLKST